MKVYVKIALSLVLHVIPAILALYLACRATADSTAGREGIFKISVRSNSRSFALNETYTNTR